MNKKPYINYLLKQIEQTLDFSVSSSSAFTRLSNLIEDKLGETVSETTLKRLWNYVNDAHSPYTSTLDILARYLGHRSFSDFCDKANATELFNSNFFEAKKILSSQLLQGEKLELGWSPNRYVCLEYLGDDRFEVVGSQNAKLLVGDKLVATVFMLGFPLFISSVFRGDEDLDSYMAGQNGGLTMLNKL